ncbi:MAG: helix-turn-helix domain-containing protein [Candidatus Aenigmatarchaeota archaeon]
MDGIVKGLKLIGLTDLEAKVYLKLLQLKEAKVSTLSKETKVTRTQLYPLMEKLVERGIVEKSGDKVLVYKVIKTEELINLVEQWEREQARLIKEIKSSLKNLK